MYLEPDNEGTPFGQRRPQGFSLKKMSALPVF